MNKRLTRLCFIGALFLCLGAFAQEKTVTGTVIDTNGAPLPGVSIVVQGTSNGTQSDFDGNFTIEVAEGSVLEFSYIGMQAQEMTVGASNTVNVTMEEGGQPTR